MSTNQKMIAWCSAWVLVDGLVVCIFCKRSQPLTQADEPFAHELTCLAIDRADTCPWATLHEILDRERG